jgi:hypothetical protein
MISASSDPCGSQNSAKTSVCAGISAFVSQGNTFSGLWRPNFKLKVCQKAAKQQMTCAGNLVDRRKSLKFLQDAGGYCIGVMFRKQNMVP